MLRSIFASERTTHVDHYTGATVIQWTQGPYKNQHLYFTTPSVTTDERWLAFISDRSGNPNLYAIDRKSGRIHLLSQNESGLLRSYVYPQGGTRGLSKSSPCLDPNSNLLYYVRDDAVYRVALDDSSGGERKICELPPQWYSAYTHVSPDGKTLCVPCTDPRAFTGDAQSQWDQLRNVPERMKAEGLRTRIYLIDVSTGAARVAAEVPFWVTHVQFDPAGTGRIIFNHEGFSSGTGRQLCNRIWCLETSGSFRPLDPELPDEWRSHENWAPDGKSIVYHGGRAGNAFVAARTWEGQLIQETSMEGIDYHHATAALDGRRLFVDRPNGFISIVDPAADRNRIVNICRHNSSMKDQDAHAHPITTPSGKSLIFTSDREGNGNVYEVGIPITFFRERTL